MAIDPHGDFLYAGTGCGLFKLRTGDAHWTPSPLIPPTPLIARAVYTIAVAPTVPTTIYVTALGDESPLRGVRYQTLFRSPDAGVTWTGPLNSITSVVIDPSRPQTAYAGATPTYTWYANGVFKSEDQGITWTSSTGGFSCSVLAIGAADPAVLYAGTYSEIFRSSDAGSTWSLVHTGDVVFAMVVDPSSSGITYAATAHGLSFPAPRGLLRITDSGATWDFFPIPVLHPGLLVLVLDPLSGALFVGSDDGVFRSDDHGEHWAIFGEGLTGLPVSSLAFGPRETLYAGTRDGIFAISSLSMRTSPRFRTRIVSPH